MKRLAILITIILCLSLKYLQAQSFVGTMTVGGYVRNNVTAHVQASSSPNMVSITLYEVKFARLMPVKLDVNLDPISKKDHLLIGDNIVPTNKDKQYEKYLVRQLEGVIKKDTLYFTCQMGKKRLNYKGTIKK